MELSWCLLSCPAGFPLSFFDDSDSLILPPFYASLGGTLTPLYEKDTLPFVLPMSSPVDFAVRNVAYYCLGGSMRTTFN